MIRPLSDEFIIETTWKFFEFFNTIIQYSSGGHGLNLCITVTFDLNTQFIDILILESSKNH